MIAEKRKSDSPWWLYRAIVIFLTLVSVNIFNDYNSFMDRGPVENNPQGRKGQGLLLLIDAIGGKWTVMALFGLTASFNFYLRYKGYKQKQIASEAPPYKQPRNEAFLNGMGYYCLITS